MKNKKATGRLKDLADIEQLKKKNNNAPRHNHNNY
jgi:hypothetical protein